MKESDVPSSKPHDYGTGNRHLIWWCGIGTALLYAGITWLSFFCDPQTPGQQRPLLVVLTLFSIAGIAYLTVCWRLIFRRQANSAKSLSVIVGWAIVFRIILLFSLPIQEVDLYRYIWDGVVTAQGISPFKFSPEEIEDQLAAGERGTTNTSFRYRTKVSEQQQVTALATLAGGEDLAQVFEQVHFKQYTTPYPPTNQPVFAIAALIGQAIGNFWGYLYAMKGILILFDIATGLVLIKLLARLSLPQTWSVAWFWCPLVMKEIANSAHLDSIAVFLTTFAIWMLVRALWPTASDRKAGIPYVSGAFAVLALAVGAKIYPIVLFPLFAVATVRRFGVRAFVPVVLFPVLVGVLLWPILCHLESVQSLKQQLTGVENRIVSAPPPGIEAFARHWEMNDFLFMVLVENLKPYGKTPEDADPAAGDRPSRIWFVKTTNAFRHHTADAVAKAVSTIEKAEAPFWLTRRITLGVFALVVLWASVRVSRSNDPRLFLEMTFLTIAWFWLLAPTQNPWYWTWALPMICFCRNPVWYLFAFTSLAYYLRFYCEYHLTGGEGKFGTPYAGTALFDFVVPILEFAPLLLMLMLVMLVRISRKAGHATDGAAAHGNEVDGGGVAATE